MTLITTTDLENAKIDAVDFGEFVNNDQVVTTRTGVTYDSIRKAMKKSLQTYAAYNNRGAWQATTAYAVNDIFISGGVHYLVVTAFTSTSNVATDIANGKVVIHQPKDWVQIVNTVALLRNFEPAYSSQIITLLGHTTAGVGGGHFRYDASDTTTSDDNGLTIVTAGGKRWKRIIENGFIDSEMFGGNVRQLLQNAQTKYAMKLMSDYAFSEVIQADYSDITIDCNGFKLLPTTTTPCMEIKGTGETGTPA